MITENAMCMKYQCKSVNAEEEMIYVVLPFKVFTKCSTNKWETNLYKHYFTNKRCTLLRHRFIQVNLQYF